jgi:predicted metal-dependent phosphoesterase TrpH
MTMSAYDLHAHTDHSDGTLSPTNLVARARANGVSMLALTDHDVTDGLPEAKAAAASQGIQFVPGVEISVTWERHTIHVVGLCIDPADETLQRGLKRLREQRWERAQQISRQLRKKNIRNALTETSGLTRGAVISRTHFARFLVSQGYANDMGQAFKHYLGRGSVAYVPGQWACLDEAVDWIRGAGGIAVVAHPSRYPLSPKVLKRLLQEFRECGGTAIEVASSSLAASDMTRLSDLAADFAFLASAGSDFHGPEKPWADVGKLPPLTPGLTPVWSAFAAA